MNWMIIIYTPICLSWHIIYEFDVSIIHFGSSGFFSLQKKSSIACQFSVARDIQGSNLSSLIHSIVIKEKNLEDRTSSYVFYRVKCIAGPQTCTAVSSRFTNSQSVSLRSLIAIRVSPQVQTGVKQWLLLTWSTSLDYWRGKGSWVAPPSTARTPARTLWHGRRRHPALQWRSSRAGYLPPPWSRGSAAARPFLLCGCPGAGAASICSCDVGGERRICCLMSMWRGGRPRVLR